jgi:hypothetical protein
MKKFLVRIEIFFFKIFVIAFYLALQTVQSNPGFQLKDTFHEKIVVAYFWTFSDIHSSHMMPKLIGIDKRYSTAGVSVGKIIISYLRIEF